MPWGWKNYAFRGYLLFQQLDRKLLEGRLPAGRITVRARFAKPVLLPSTVAVHTAVAEGAAVVGKRRTRTPGLHVRTEVSGSSA